MENQKKVITFGVQGKYDDLYPQIKPVDATWLEMKEMRELGKLLPGQWYRITDYVATVNQHAIGNARSAGHPFDIIVRADDSRTLNEQAFAIRHEGDQYFKDARLEAWELKYCLDNVQWSLQKGVYMVSSENSGYTFVKDGTVTVDGTTYIKWRGDAAFAEDYSDYVLTESEEVGATVYVWYGDPEETIEEEFGTIETIDNEQNEGKGTVLWMKDECNNECPYDFKSIQFKRWKVTDEMEGRTGFTDTYMCGDPNNTPEKLAVEDETDFIWAYTFSSDNTGGEQTDYSLDGTHNVYGNVIKEMGDGSLNNNVMFGNYNYCNTFSQGCYNNSFSQSCQYNSFSQNCYSNSFSQNCQDNSFSQNCYRNSFSQDCSNNSFSQNCSNNSFSQECQYNSFSQNCYRNSFSQNCYRNSFSQNCSNNSFSQNCQNNSFSQYCYNNSFSQGCYNNSFSQGCYNNSFSQDCYRNSFSQNVNQVTLGTNYMQNIEIGAGNQYITLACSASPTSQQPCKNVKVNMGVNNTTTNKAITITTKNQNYQTVVASENDALIEV